MARGRKFVYFFGGGKAEGKAGMRELLGGKGAGLHEMTRIGVPVPPGFTITTEVCSYYYGHRRQYPKGLERVVTEALRRIEKNIGRRFGDPHNPLLVSVRSGARDSMPAHRALLQLRKARGDWQGAADAGERLARLEGDAGARARIHVELGEVDRAGLTNLKRARLHYERALRLVPDDADALEGLAETYATRGEPARAAAYLSRLVEQAEQAGRTDRIVAFNLRLGEIWSGWLASPEQAAARYQRVLEVDPGNNTARLPSTSARMEASSPSRNSSTRISVSGLGTRTSLPTSKRRDQNSFSPVM